MDAISIIGLGYAGLHTALAFAKKRKVIGFDTNPVRIKELSEYEDRHHEFSKDELQASKITFTTDPSKIREANFHIVIVPTPVNLSKEPDLNALRKASEILGKQIKKQDVVVFESTVYPGVTEDVCIPILEEVSHLKCGEDFYAGYSPERINPGDKVHTFHNTVKIVSGSNQKSLALIKEKYEEIVDAGVFCVSSIKAGEAVKVVENAQRDVNIAFINEIAQILHLFDLDTLEIIKAAKTKWNFLGFKPGLVGGHCIAVDPYYLIHRAEELGYYPNLLISARRINDQMGRFIARELIKRLMQAQINVVGTEVAILGITYKENTSDIRNTQVIEMIDELTKHQINVKIYDPMADPEEVFKEYKIQLTQWKDIHNVSGMIIAVGHRQFKSITEQEYLQKFSGKGVLVDVKGILNPDDFESSRIEIWRL